MSGSEFRWDLPIRLFHWTLVSAVAVALLSGWQGGAWMELHAAAGYLILALLGFRLVWGFIGPPPSRWGSLLRRLGTLRAGAVASADHGPGHTPSGVVSVLFLLVLLAAQASAGLLSNDEIGFAGPLAGWVSDEVSLRLTGWHRLASDAVWAWIVLHLAAMAYYRYVKRAALLPRMRLGWPAISLIAVALSLALTWFAGEELWGGTTVSEAPAPVPAASAVGGW